MNGLICIGIAETIVGAVMGNGQRLEHDILRLGQYGQNTINTKSPRPWTPMERGGQ